MPALPPVDPLHQQNNIQQPPTPRPSRPVASSCMPIKKRPRSPSPGPVPLHHQDCASRSPAVSSASYQSSPQEYSRRSHKLFRAVLWNKSKYDSQPDGSCTMPPQDLVHYPPMKPKNVEHCSIQAAASAHMAINSPAIAISSSEPPAKTGSIPAGCPVRIQEQCSPQTPVSTSALNTAATRPLRPSPGLNQQQKANLSIATSNNAKGPEQMWDALKAHIIRERKRKRQDREQEVEEDWQQKEREARKHLDAMSLEEMREQIQQLEEKLCQLKDEKNHIVLELKNVFIQDDNRRRQMFKENNDSRRPVSASSMPIKKRPRSPSPGRVPLYHQDCASKSPAVSSASYQSSPQTEDNRSRRKLFRAVLWNKSQSTSQPDGFYTVPPQDMVHCPPMTSKDVEHCSIQAPASAHMAMNGPAIAISSSQPPAKTGSITASCPVRAQEQYSPQTPVSTLAMNTAAAVPLLPSPGAPLP